MSEERLKVFDKILSELRSRLNRCVPDPDEREHCERLCRDLRVQYKGTMEAWEGTLEYVLLLEAELEDGS